MVYDFVTKSNTANIGSTVSDTGIPWVKEIASLLDNEINKNQLCDAALTELKELWHFMNRSVATRAEKCYLNTTI